MPRDPAEQAEVQITAAALGPGLESLADQESILLQDGQATGSSVVESNSVAWKDGRTYHGYDEGAYLLPNDGPEQDRLDIQHAMCTLLIDRMFGLAPFQAAPRRVLDVATGTGIWALEFARQNPLTYVVGTDLNLIQPQPDVPNCEFIQENSETSEWIFPYLFDYVHCRYTMTAFDDTTSVIHKAFNSLQPGGWCEFYDPDGQVHFEGDPSTWQSSGLKRWADIFYQSLTSLGRDPRKAMRYKEWFEQAGFVDVVEEVFCCPGSPWKEGDRYKQVGMFARADAKAFFKSAYKLVASLGLSIDEMDELSSRCIRELDDLSVHQYYNFHVVYGRKPRESEMTQAQKEAWAATKQKIVQLEGDKAEPEGDRFIVPRSLDKN